MTYEFKFDLGFVNLVLTGLSKLPFEHSAQAIQLIQQEVANQDAKAKAVPQAEAGLAQNEGKKRGRKAKSPANGATEAQPQA